MNLDRNNYGLPNKLLPDPEVICVIDSDGNFRVKVDPTDKNARKFIDLVNENIMRDNQLLAAIKVIQ